MKIKILLVAAVIGVASLSARAGVYFGFSLGLPRPAVVVAAPVVVATPSVVVAAPACPGPGYVWAPGYWSVCGPSRVWVAGCWRGGPAVRVGYGYGWHGGGYGWHGGGYGGHDWHR